METKTTEARNTKEKYFILFFLHIDSKRRTYNLKRNLAHTVFFLILPPNTWQLTDPMVNMNGPPLQARPSLTVYLTQFIMS